jgi:hypothetical protein
MIAMIAQVVSFQLDVQIETGVKANVQVLTAILYE